MRLEIHSEAEKKMQKTHRVLQEQLVTIRAGRANPGLLDKISIDYYGVPTPLNQIAGISAPEPRLLMVQPYDSSTLKDIEKAILKSDLGINPNNDGKGNKTGDFTAYRGKARGTGQACKEVWRGSKDCHKKREKKCQR